MANPSNVEFGWNETVGYTKYGDKYKLLYVKPTLSFQFKILYYSTVGAETYDFIKPDGQEGTLTEEQLREVNAYTISVSTSSNWDFKIPDEVLKGASLSGETLKFPRQDGSEIDVPIGGIIPPYIRVRKKTEVKAVGAAYTMTSGQSYNIVDLFTQLGIDTGELEPFVKQAGKLLKPFNSDSDVHYKVALLGTWSGGGGSTRSMEMTIGTATENRFVQNRSDAVTSDSFTFSSMIAVDKGGPAATNGVAFSVKPNGGNFAITTVFLAATQYVLPSETQLP